MTQRLGANQLVAYNLMRIRKTLGLDQDQAAARLEPYIGEKWSKAVYSAAERSYHGKRVRKFTADDLVAFSLAFGVPVIFFFMPPKDEDRTIGKGADSQDVAGAVSGKAEVSWRDLFEVMLGGEFRLAVQQRMSELSPEDRPMDSRSPVLAALAALTGARAERWALGDLIPDDETLRRLRAEDSAFIVPERSS
jgi:hypothetical protein